LNNGVESKPLQWRVFIDVGTSNRCQITVWR
jgi:hypothetical protein